MNTAKEYADVFTSSEEYARRFAGETGAYLIKRQSKILDKFFKDIKPESILDVGGGHGHIANNFSADYKITVLGSTANCSQQISDPLSRSKCAFEYGDVETLKYPDGSFDVVTCLRYISHTENWQGVIKELCRVAKRAVIIDFPPLFSFNLLSPILYKLKKNLEGNTRTFTVFTKREINQEFLKNNFKLYMYHAQFFFPMVVHRMLQSASISESIELIPEICGLSDFFGSPSLAFFKKDSSIQS